MLYSVVFHFTYKLSQNVKALCTLKSCFIETELQVHNPNDKPNTYKGTSGNQVSVLKRNEVSGWYMKSFNK